MLGKLRKMLYNQKGFTLVELMTVLIILGVILGIGVPRYLKIQAKAQWDADATTIENFARAAQIYATQRNDFSPVKINAVLIQKGLIDGDIELSSKKAKIKDLTSGTNDKQFEFVDGEVSNLTQITESLIGKDPYEN